LHPPKNLDRQFLGVDAAGKLPDVHPELGRVAVYNRRVRQADGIDEAKWCPTCEMWLNSTKQWEEHKIGKLHRQHDTPATRHNSKTTTEVAAGSKQGGTPSSGRKKGSKQPSATNSVVSNKVPDGPPPAPPPPPPAPPAPPAPCSIQQRGPPSPKMPIDGGDRRHADGGSGVSLTQHVGIAQGSTTQGYQAVLVLCPEPPATQWNGGDLPTQVEACTTAPVGWIWWDGYGWWPAAPWYGDGTIIQCA
jgi:hypothetical protein